MEASNVKTDTDDLLNSLNRNVQYQNKKITELQQNKQYRVKQLKSVQTKFGRRCIVKLHDNEVGEFDMFLPDRYSNTLERNVDNIALVYKGMKSMKNGQNYHDIGFERLLLTI